jgi:hypothetical protein
MTAPTLDALRLPVGKWQRPTEISARDIEQWIIEIAAFPAKLRAATEGQPDAILDTPYRPEGWTVRQVIHHVADSHANAYIRFKLTLTEDSPTPIRPYMEDRWARLPDYKLPIEPALRLLEAIHEKWVYVMQNMQPEEWQRAYLHPEYKNTYRLEEAASSYAWHSRHHLAHVMLVVGK